MAGDDSPSGTGDDFGGEVDSEPEADFDQMAGILTDGIIGSIGGLVGTAAMTVGLLIAETLDAFDMAALSILAELTGLSAIVPLNPLALGYLIFLFGGMVLWPLLFVSAGLYLPGKNFATKGIPFGFVIWTGFVLAFAQGIEGDVGTYALYALLTLLSHFAYGFTLGAVFDYLSGRPETLV